MQFDIAWIVYSDWLDNYERLTWQFALSFTTKHIWWHDKFRNSRNPLLLRFRAMGHLLTTVSPGETVDREDLQWFEDAHIPVHWTAKSLPNWRLFPWMANHAQTGSSCYDLKKLETFPNVSTMLLITFRLDENENHVTIDRAETWPRLNYLCTRIPAEWSWVQERTVTLKTAWMPNLTILRLEEMYFQIRMIVDWSGLSNLQHLVLMQTEFRVNAPEQLFPRLRKLVIWERWYPERCIITAEWTAFIERHLPQIRILVLNGAKVGNWLERWLPRLTSLEELSLPNDLSARAFAWPPSLKRLEILQGKQSVKQTWVPFLPQHIKIA